MLAEQRNTGFVRLALVGTLLLEVTRTSKATWEFGQELLYGLGQRKEDCARIAGRRRKVVEQGMLGLFAFFYACLHALTYFWLDQFFDIEGIVKDIIKRPFITIGFGAFLLLLPLAVTSTNGMVRRLGGRAWQRLHKLAYVAGILGVAHYWWLVKKDLTEPILYACILATLFAVRLWHARRLRAHVAAQTT